MSRKNPRQAVVIIHGMGEQIPMETVRGFVDTVWRQDPDLIDRDRPVQGFEGRRTFNPTWSRPDTRTGLYETRRITTELGDNGYYTDFFEFYWAHLVHGTTWDQVRAWVIDLLWRNPSKRVPADVFPAWVLLWAATIVISAIALLAAIPKGDGFLSGSVASLFFAGFSLISAWVISTIMIARFGDVVRYTKAEPPNIARREEIRRAGVTFLNSLIRERDPRNDNEPRFDRIIVVAHSLGSIVAYDILSECFALNCRGVPETKDPATRQPARAALEDAVRHALGLHSVDEPDERLTPERYQDLQTAALKELNAQGATWQVSDFVTLGSPLTHAEFLLAESDEDLRARQEERLLATCPPVFEYDGKSKLNHFTFRRGDIATVGVLSDDENDDPAAELALPRWPHPAALFGYTRWTNLYSPHKAVFAGDVISGPLAAEFGIGHGANYFCGIRDVPVMPMLDPETGEPDANHRRRLVTHTSYWSMQAGTEIEPETDPDKGAVLPPHHIRELRKALGLGPPG